jgi:iron complex transport system ATP-binding protein
LGEARRQAREGRAVFVILHDLNLAAAYADEVVLMHRGRVKAKGRAEEVFQDELLSEVYGCPVRTNTVPSDGIPFVLPYVGAA